MSTRCKFKCEEVIQGESGYEYKFIPVVSGSAENEAFFKWTPYGSLKFGVTEKREFIPGEEYYIDITPAPKTV